VKFTLNINQEWQLIWERLSAPSDDGKKSSSSNFSKHAHIKEMGNTWLLTEKIEQITSKTKNPEKRRNKLNQF
jgi:hypothetical protein